MALAVLVAAGRAVASHAPGGEPVNDKTAATPTPVTASCGCNHTTDSREVVAEPRYGLFGYSALLFGVTARPKRVDFVCTRCGETIHRAHDAATIDEHTN